MNAIKRVFAAALVLVLLAGCQEIQGPVWSLDGQWVAYTVYARQAGGGFHPSVYVTNPDADDPTPRLLAYGAAFPQWTSDGTLLFYLAERDPQGYFTKIMRFHPGDEKPEVALAGVRLTSMQLAAGNNGPLMLLSMGRDSKPGSLVSAELWSALDNKRTNLRTLGEMYGPAISANGKMLVYGTKPVEGHAILMAAELNGGEAKAVFPTATNTEPNASSFVVTPFPSSERFLFYGPGMANVWTMTGKPGAAKFARYPIPDGLTCPVMARVAEDSNSAMLTLMRATPGRLTYESYRLDFAQNRWTRLDGNADEPIGGNALDPAAKKRQALRSAWLSSGGLAVGDAAKPHWFPVTADQCIAASTLLLKSNEPEKALEVVLKAQDAKPPPENSEALNQALFAAYMANKKFDRATDIFEQGWLLEPVGRAGVRFIFPPESGLPPPAPEWVAQQLKSMDELIAAAPENRMIPLLKAALLARQKGAQREALEAYRKAMDYCPDRARVGGVRFLQGVCNLELDDLVHAAEMFEQAARIDDFPQADFAAGMSAMAYYLDARPDSITKAAAALQLPAARKSAIVTELAQIPAMLKGKSSKDHGATPEAIGANGDAHAWAEYDTYWIPVVFSKPVWMEVGDGKFANRRVGVKCMTATSIYTNKQPTPIFRLARPVTAPKLSPSGSALAFTVSGEIFPVPDNFCELMVLDLTGGVVNGNAQAAAAGRTKSRQILTQFSWSGNSEISLTGVDVDVFGGQKAFEKTVPVGRGGVRKTAAP